MTQIIKKEIKEAVVDSVREAMAEQLAQMRAMLLDYVSRKEQTDISKRYKNAHEYTKSAFKIRL